MTRPHVLVTAAGGKVGHSVARQLLDRGARVRALVHREGCAAQELRALGADVRPGNIFDPRDMRAAVAGVDAVVQATPFHPHALDAAVVLVDAMTQARVTDVVQLSQWLASPDHPSLATRHAWLAERLLASVPALRSTVVAPGYFADNYLVMTGTAAQTGLFLIPHGKARNAPPSNEDIASVMTGAVLDPDRHAGRRYRPTGPRLLSGDDMAEAIGAAVGHRVRYVDVPLWMYLRALRVTGPRVSTVDAFTIAGMECYSRESRAGTWELGAPTEDVRLVGGREPEEFADIAVRYAARPQFRRTPATMLRGLADVLLMSVTPTPRAARLARRQQHPVLAATSLSGDSRLWRSEHLAGTSPDRLSAVREVA